jgi:hypothetical protein
LSLHDDIRSWFDEFPHGGILIRLKDGHRSPTLRSQAETNDWLERIARETDCRAVVHLYRARRLPDAIDGDSDLYAMLQVLDDVHMPEDLQ